MQELNYESFAETLEEKQTHQSPLSGQLELTYRCNLHCIHCYCNLPISDSAAVWERL